MKRTRRKYVVKRNGFIDAGESFTARNNKKPAHNATGGVMQNVRKRTATSPHPRRLREHRCGRSPDLQLAVAFLRPFPDIPVGHAHDVSCLQLRGSCRITRHSHFHSPSGETTTSISKNKTRSQHRVAIRETQARCFSFPIFLSQARQASHVFQRS